MCVLYFALQTARGNQELILRLLSAGPRKNHSVQHIYKTNILSSVWGRAQSNGHFEQKKKSKWMSQTLEYKVSEASELFTCANAQRQ